MKHLLHTIINVIFNLTSPFFLWLPFADIRRWYLRLFVKSLGKKTYIGRNVDVKEPSNISIGHHSVINKNVVLNGRGGLVIGNNVDIAQDVFIFTEQHDQNDDMHALVKKSVHIDDYVWIASRATILPGTNIGRGAVVACGSVVTKDVVPMTVVGGVPAKYMSDRKSGLKYSFNYREKYSF
jgi:maltose O-acetyltransferase